MYTDGAWLVGDLGNSIPIPEKIYSHGASLITLPLGSIKGF